ncbi:sigma-70 family RNA polymerase sigma factor [Nocardiopsis sp. NPDC055824]
MTRDGETGEPTRTAIEALYDAFAPPLYRYAWALLGDDPEQVSDAVHDGLVAGVVLDARRSDPADRGPWLYALVRSACQRRGLAHVSPYTGLATVPAEAPVARMFAGLPASHRELVELHLRHALPTSATARVLGLDPAICGELTRSAIRRAAECLAEATGGSALADRGEAPPEGARAGEALPDAPGGIGSPGSAAWRAQVHEVSSALALLRPPGPPPGLRERVLLTCLDPGSSGVRDRIAAQMHPLTGEGYPLHRSRVPGEPEEVPEAFEPGPEPLPRALPGDRLTTADHPAHEEGATPLPGPRPEQDDEGARRRRADHRRWSLPAVSGLATVAVAVSLWAWASAVGGPSTMIGTAPAEAERGPGASDVETASTASDAKPEAGPTGPDSEPTAPASPEVPGKPGDDAPGEEASGEGTPDGGAAPAPSAGEQSPPADGGPDDDPDGSDRDGSGDDDAPGDPSEEDGSDDGGGGGGLFDGLLGLLFGGG